MLVIHNFPTSYPLLWKTTTFVRLKNDENQNGKIWTDLKLTILQQSPARFGPDAAAL